MHPVLFSLGPIHIFSLPVLVIFAWVIFAFLFWRGLRRFGVTEDRIFDLTFYATLVAIVTARIGFVLLNRSLFTDSLLKIAAVWVAPGFWFYGGLLGAMATFIFLSRRFKVRLGLVLDAVAGALPLALSVGKIGALLDGSEVGKMASLPWAVRYTGHVGYRHPVQLYEILVLVILAVLTVYLGRRAEREKWSYGLVGVWFFTLLASVMFIIEFFKESGVYWLSINWNQWILVGLFAEALGALYVRGGGRERFLPAVGYLVSKVKKGVNFVYAKIPRRGFRGNSGTS